MQYAVVGKRKKHKQTHNWTNWETFVCSRILGFRFSTFPSLVRGYNNKKKAKVKLDRQKDTLWKLFKSVTKPLTNTDYTTLTKPHFLYICYILQGFSSSCCTICIKLVYPFFTIFNGRRLSLVTMNTSEHKETIKRIALQLSENKKKPSSIFWTNQLDIKLVEMVAY